MDNPISHAPPESVLGQLQRGRGAGYRSALAMPKAQVWPMLVECITNDPRLDSQVEDRADYYANLVIETRMDLAPIKSHLQDNDDDDENWGWNTRLTVEVLDELTKRGSTETMDLLLEYLPWGTWWYRCIHTVIKHGNDTNRSRIAAALEKRFPNQETLASELNSADDGGDSWKLLSTYGKRIAKVIESVPESATPLSTVVIPSSLSEMLDGANKQNRFIFAKAAQAVVTESDVELLVGSVSTDNPSRSYVAIRALEKLAPPDLFDWAVEEFQKSREYGLIRQSIIRLIKAMPADSTLPFAQSWIFATDTLYSGIAADLMELHATVEDIPLLQRAINLFLLDDEEYIYPLCNSLEALQRFPDFGRIPELEDVFERFRYSYGRRLAALAMATTSPDTFEFKYAIECLWDCDEGIRELGAKLCPIDDKAVRDRLLFLSLDPHEEEAVRAAARAR